MRATNPNTPTWIKERRRAVRVALGTHASISGGSTQSSSQRMIVANICESGIRLEGCGELNVGYSYNLQLKLPNGKEVSGLVKVVWKNPEPYIHTYGAELVPLSWGDRRRLKVFIDKTSGKVDDNFAVWKVGVGVVAAMAIFRSFWSLASFGWPAAVFAGIMTALYLCFAQFTREVRH